LQLLTLVGEEYELSRLGLGWHKSDILRNAPIIKMTYGDLPFLLDFVKPSTKTVNKYKLGRLTGLCHTGLSSSG
jgi:hypothetical protein